MYRSNIFTSEFLLYGPLEFQNLILSNLPEVQNNIFEIYDGIKKNKHYYLGGSSLSEHLLACLQVYTQRKYGLNHVIDITSSLKGLFLRQLLESVPSLPDKFLISLGGDLVARGGYEIQIENSFTSIDINDEIVAIFTSGNTEKRGEHILLSSPQKFKTLTTVIYDPRIEYLDLYDAFTTVKYAGQYYDRLWEDHIFVYTDERGNTTIRRD